MNTLETTSVEAILHQPSRLCIKIYATVKTDYKIKSFRQLNLLPKSINTITSLDNLKVALGKYLRSFPDTPPVPGYTAVNRNSLLDWSNEKGGRT